MSNEDSWSESGRWWVVALVAACVALSGCAADDELEERVATVEQAVVISMAATMSYAHQAGIPCDDRLVLAGAVAAAESGLDTEASNCGGNSPPSCDRGLWQINSYWHSEVSDACAYDPLCNAQAMVAISNGGTDWSPWWAYNYGNHEQYIGAAQTAFADACAPPNLHPTGWLDAAGCEVTGWAQDPDFPDAALGIHLYVGGPAGDPNAYGIDLGPAAGYRDDLCTAIGSCNHGFSMILPQAWRDDAPRPFYAYTFDASEGFPVQLQGSPLSGSCPRLIPPIALEGGIKRWVTGPASFDAWSWHPLEVAPLEDATVQTYADGPNFPDAPAVVRAGDGTPEVWVLDGSTRRHVIDPDSLLAWRLESQVQIAPAAEVYAYAVGLDWPARPFLFRGSGPEVYLLDVASAEIDEPQDPDGEGGSAPGEVNGAGDGGDGEITPSADASDPGDDAGLVGHCGVAAPPPRRTPWGYLAMVAVLLGASLGRRSIARMCARRTRKLAGLVAVGVMSSAAPAQAILRSDVLSDAQSWVNAGVPYSQGPWGYYCAWDYCYPDPLRGGGCYRSDCSGFVSATWGIEAPGLDTWGLCNASVSYEIPFSALQPGDAIILCDQHVMLFRQWLGGDTLESYEEYACNTPAGILQHSASGLQAAGYKAIRYNHIQDDPPPNALPNGWLDAASCEVSGWAQDPDAPDAALGIHLYVGGPAGDPNAYGIDLGPAAGYRDDLCSAIGSCNHGFSMVLPQAWRDDVARPVYAYTFDANDGTPVMLQASPLTGSCPRLAPPLAPPDGIKRWVAGPASFDAWSWHPLEIAPLEDAIVASYPDGPNLPDAPQVVQANDGTLEVWVLDGAFRRHVIDPDSLLAWRLEGKVQVVPAADVYAYAQGIDWLARPFLFRGSGPEVYVLDQAQPDLGGEGGEGGADDGDPEGGATSFDGLDNEPQNAGSYDGEGLEGACGCRLPGDTGSSSWGPWLLGAMALTWGARRRRLSSSG